MKLKQGINLTIDRFIHQSITSYGAPSKDWYMLYYGTPILGPAFFYQSFGHFCRNGPICLTHMIGPLQQFVKTTWNLKI
jgi:hypothetical protein